MDLHEFVAPFAEHLGAWSGFGRGYYPTIDGFEYNETKRFYTFNGDQLTTAFHMAAVGESMTKHLESTLHRTTADRTATGQAGTHA